MPDPGNRAPSGIDAWPSATRRFRRYPLQRRTRAIEGELRSHDYQRELAVGTQKTTLTQRVWEVHVDSVPKLDRAAKRETSDENQLEVPR